MTNSRSSRFPRSSWLTWLAAVGLILVTLSASAEAGRRRRIVVLDFDGPKAETFQAGVIQLIKRSHTVVSLEVWNRVAEELAASKLTERNIKKVARKLKIDGIVTGEIEKRRDDYLIRLKLKAGTNGELVGRRFDTKSRGAKLDAKAQREIKEELIAAIDELELNRGGEVGADDSEQDAESETKPKKKRSENVELTDDGDAREPAAKPGRKLKQADDVDTAVEEPTPRASKRKSAAQQSVEIVDDEEAPAKSKARKAAAKPEVVDDQEAPAKSKARTGAAKPEVVDDEEAPAKSKARKSAAKPEVVDDEEAPAKSKSKPKADVEDDETADAKAKFSKQKKMEDTDDAERPGNESAGKQSVRSKTDAGMPVLTPVNRAIDVVIGASFNLRRLQFDADGDLANAPPAYRQSTPVAGGLIHMIGFPFALGKTRTGFLSGVGLEFMYDRVLYIRSQKKYVDGAQQQQIADLATTQDRYLVGLVVRYPVSDRFVVGGKAQYSSQRFNIGQQLPNGESTDVPSVGYAMIEPKLFLHYLPIPALSLNVEGGFMVVSKSGDIERAMTGYGSTSTSGFEASIGVDYNITKNVFVRVLGRLTRFSLTFQGDPNSLSNTRDSDAMQDVRGATDLYLGGAATVGYAY